VKEPCCFGSDWVDVRWPCSWRLSSVRSGAGREGHSLVGAAKRVARFSSRFLRCASSDATPSRSAFSGCCYRARKKSAGHFTVSTAWSEIARHRIKERGKIQAIRRSCGCSNVELELVSHGASMSHLTLMLA
jgi:hypothetical protein